MPSASRCPRVVIVRILDRIVLLIAVLCKETHERRRERHVSAGGKAKGDPVGTT